jgi:hypothetical protein
MNYTLIAGFITTILLWPNSYATHLNSDDSFNRFFYLEPFEQEFLPNPSIKAPNQLAYGSNKPIKLASTPNDSRAHLTMDIKLDSALEHWIKNELKQEPPPTRKWTMYMSRIN